jgi:hypothetical protein
MTATMAAFEVSRTAAADATAISPAPTNPKRSLGTGDS